MDLLYFTLTSIATLLVAFGVNKAIKIERQLELEKAKTKNRDNFIEKQEKKEICLREENKSLRNENEDLRDCVKEFEKLSKEKHFNSAENLQNKMKSILNDYHINSTCK